MKAKRFLSAVSAALLPIALLTGCSSDNTSEAPSAAATTAAASSEATEAPDAGTRVVVDQYGNDIEIPANVERIGATIGAFAHIIVVDGGEDKLVAAIPMVGEGLFHEVWPNANPGGHDPANVEELIAAGTQVVIGPNFTDEVAAQLEAAGIVPIKIDKFGTPEEMQSVITLVGEILGDDAPEKAATFNKFYAGTIADVEKRVADVPEAERVKTLNLRAGGDGYSTVDGKDISSAYVTSAGGVVVSADFDTSSGSVGAEQIIEWAPDVIFTMGQGAREQIINDPALATVPAVANGKVYTEPSGTYPWSVRSAEGVLMPVFLGTILHPDKFADLDLAKVTKDYYKTYYGYDLTDAQVADILDGDE
ncbi:MAG: ABC transporter substrate-binding protein [Ancrocorticia sp.]